MPVDQKDLDGLLAQLKDLTAKENHELLQNVVQQFQGKIDDMEARLRKELMEKPIEVESRQAPAHPHVAEVELTRNSVFVRAEAQKELKDKLGEIEPCKRRKAVVSLSTEDARAAWESFLAAGEVDEVESTFGKLVQFAGAEDLRGQGLLLFQAVKARILPLLNFRQKKLFNDLDAQISKRRKLIESLQQSQPEDPNAPRGQIVVCGAGPVGLRAAVELALLGFQVKVVEKRHTFSRANILMLWERTWRDLLSLGAKIYLPNIPAHARDTGVPFYMGTRELQLTFLKTSVLLGVEVIYGHELIGLLAPQGPGSQWLGRVVPFVKSHVKEVEGLKHEEAADPSEAAPEKADPEAVKADEEAKAAVEGLKNIAKSDDYAKAIGKCNRMQYAEVDARFVSGDPETVQEGEIRLPFDNYIIAEGEWSSTTKKLGFSKMIDQFAQALGVVINMSYDPSDPAQKKLESYTRGPSGQDEVVNFEFMEYLKGETHYIVMCIKKESLLQHGVFKEDRAKTAELLRAENLDITRLKAMARAVATAEGIPESTEFYPANPVQIFDFSSRARCLESVKLLSGGAACGGGSLLSATRENCSAAQAAAAEVGRPALVMPIGDAIMEPFWPQGLGSNRGFHFALNAAWACLVGREVNFVEAAPEVRFAYQMVIMGTFTPRELNPYDTWTTDTMSRFARHAMGLARGKIKKEEREADDLPERIARLPMTQFG